MKEQKRGFGTRIASSVALLTVTIVAEAWASGSAASKAQLPLRLAGELAPGEYSIGFRKETLPSALDLYLWYPTRHPAKGDATDVMVYADYYRAQENEPPDRAALREWVLEDMTSPPNLGVGDLDRVLDAPMWARIGADPLPGPYPLVLWSYRDSVPTMQTALNEYLASHGYVVAFAWPADNAPPLPWQQELTAEDKKRVLRDQVRILEAALDALSERPWIDSTRTGVLAWSYGGESARELQRRRSEVRLALGIDATLAGGGVFLAPDDLAALDRAELSVPYVLLRNGRPRLGAEGSPSPPLLAEIPAGAWHLRFTALSHGNFNFPGGMIPGVLGLPEVSRWAVGGATARRGYELVCRYSLRFLDLHLRASATDPASWFDLAPDEVRMERYRPRGSGQP